VARRRVFYIPGYDPYPPRRYRELFRTESRKQAKISGYEIDQKSDQSETGWKVRARIEGKEVQSKIDVLLWNDLVQSSMSSGQLGTYLALVKTCWIYISTGTLRRLSWLAKGPVLAALYPVVALLLQLTVALIAASSLAGFANFLTLALIDMILGLFTSDPGRGGFFRTLVGAVVFGFVFLSVTFVVLRWFKARDDKLYAHYLMHDYAYTANGRGAYPEEIEARLVEFRHRLEAAMRSEIDEVLVVGHSSGAQLAVSLVADIIRSNHFQDAMPALSLLTLGQVIPMLSFLPDARRLRGDLRLLSMTDQAVWLDVSAPGDGCCFALSDPVAVSGVAPNHGQKWPIVISAAFTKTLTEETLKTLKHRYFRLHFQYLCAFDRPSDYDYFKITAGPLTLEERFRNRKSSQSRVDVPASRYTSISTTIEQ